MSSKTRSTRKPLKIKSAKHSLRTTPYTEKPKKNNDTVSYHG